MNNLTKENIAFILDKKVTEIVIGEDVVLYKCGDEMGDLVTDKELLELCMMKIEDSPMEMNLSSHRTFYLQWNGNEWYSGFSHVKTNHGDIITYQDLGSGKTRLECLLSLFTTRLKYGKWSITQEEIEEKNKNG